MDHIGSRASFAFETTLRSEVTFRQAALARNEGFTTEMQYVALRDFTLHFARVKERAFAGGHSAPASLLESIYHSSLAHLPRAIREMDFITVYDNSRWGLAPTILLQAERGDIVYVAVDIPDWLARCLDEL